MKKKISIIIPVYNSSKTLSYCLNSILKQDYENYEVILINDGSTDNTEIICKKFISINNKIKLYSQKNCGVSQARNIGLQYATGELIYFMDSDDVVSPNLLNVINDNYIEKCELLCFEYKKIFSYNYLFNEIQKEINVKQYKEDEYKKEILNTGNGFLWNKVYKKSIIDKNNIKFKKNIFICEDLLFNFEYISTISNIFCLNFIGYGYYQAENSSFNKLNNLNWFTILDAYYEIEKKCISHNQEINDLISYNIAYHDCEAISRNKINTIKYENIKLVYNDFFRRIKKILTSKYVHFIKKIKLILFFVFPKTILKIKRKKLKKEVMLCQK